MPNRSGNTLVDRPPPAPTVGVVPASGNGRPTETRPTRRALRHRRRRRRWIAFVAVFALLLAGIATALMVRADDGDARGGATAPSGVSEAADRNALLVALVDPDGTARRLFLFGDDDAGEPSVMLLPVGTQVEVPSMGLQSFGDVPALGDAALLPVTVSSAVGVSLDEPTAFVPTVEFSELLSSIPSIDVELRQPVEVETFEGALRLDAGHQALTGEEASLLLALRGRGSELDDLVTVQAVLEGLLSSLAAPDLADRFRTAVPQLARFVDGGGKDVRFDTLPVEPMASGFEERYRIRENDLAGAVDRMLPGTRLELDGTRPRTEIRNGTGEVGVTVRAAEIVVPLGAEITLTGNVRGFGVAETTVQYHRPEAREAATKLAEALGGVPVGRADPALGSVDITIVVGADFPTGS